MSSQRMGRHQRRASQSVFVLPENFAALDDVPAASDDHRNKASPDGGPAEQQQQQGARRHRRAMSMAVASSRDLEMIKEDMGGGYNTARSAPKLVAAGGDGAHGCARLSLLRQLVP